MSKLSEDTSCGGSSLSSHKRYKNKLVPPFLQLNNLELTSWLHNRLPEMLWAVLIIGSFEREKALEFFRYVAMFVNKNKEYFDISLTGLGKLPPEKTRTFIKYMLGWSEEVPNILRALRLYPGIPAADIWSELLEEPVPEEDWNKLFVSIQKTLFHQSQEATDCRWIRVLCLMIGGKITLSRDMEEIAKEISEYPNYGDMRKVRPTIRSIEMSMEMGINDEPGTWPMKFWEHNYVSTDCILEEIVSSKIKIRKEEFSQELKNSRGHFITEIERVRNKLFTHFFESVNSTKVVPRHETSFGLTLYSLALFAEIVLYRNSSSITGRLVLRSLIEVYITFKYLLIKEKDSLEIWDDFHGYGTGQSKLILLKLNELTQQSNCIELNELSQIVDEDRSVEFIPINLGHWGKSDLRKMSEYAGVKEIYDLYYNYTSGFVHGTRGAIRESVYQTCLNPLHRYHRIPQYNIPIMPSVIFDSVEIVNKILACLNDAYPSFDDLITLPQDKEETESKEE